MFSSNITKTLDSLSEKINLISLLELRYLRGVPVSLYFFRYYDWCIKSLTRTKRIIQRVKSLGLPVIFRSPVHASTASFKDLLNSVFSFLISTISCWKVRHNMKDTYRLWIDISRHTLFITCRHLTWNKSKIVQSMDHNLLKHYYVMDKNLSGVDYYKIICLSGLWATRVNYL